MYANLSKKKASGQSIPLIALMIVVLIGMVGLSVDVGNQYAQQRTVVRAVNSASLAGMNTLIQGGSDQNIASALRESLKSNGVNVAGDPIGPGEGEGTPAPTTDSRQMFAYYLGPDGRVLNSCQIGQCSTVPPGVTYIQVRVDGNVETYFARVAGTSTLPVKAQSFATRCTPTNGVYPLAINRSDLLADRFKEPTDLPVNYKAERDGAPYGTYSDDVYSGKFYRRIFLKDNSTASGNFSFLRWRADPNAGSQTATAEMFKGDGNLEQGFEEVKPWPDASTTATANYPLVPGQLTVGDWAYGNSGLSWAGGGDGLRTELLNKMERRTILILPIVDKIVGGGNNSKYRVDGLGAFYIVDPQPTDPNNGGVSKNGGQNAYIDLVYLGKANEVACLQTNVEPPTNGPGTQNYNIQGYVNVTPRWKENIQPHQPIAYQIVLDVSGSMSHNFPGEGSMGGTVRKEQNTTGSYTNVRCEWSSTSTRYEYNDKCSGGPNSPWWNYQERRIYIAKQAITSFIDLMDANDTMRFTVFTDGNSSVNDGNTKVIPVSGWSGDKALLKAELLKAGTMSGSTDPYLTQGGTPGAQAMNKARSVVAGSPDVAPNGRAYRNVVIYLTDGVANVFLNGNSNTARDICGDITIQAARNTPRCQIGTTSSGTLRPIDAMIAEAQRIKDSDPQLSLYVVALAGVATDGLQKVASDSSMLYSATDPNAVTSIFQTINAQVEGNNCKPAGGTEWLSKINPENYASFPPPTVWPADKIGDVYIYQKGGSTPIRILPMVPDPLTGKMSYSTINTKDANGNYTAPIERQPLAAGEYEIEAAVGFKTNAPRGDGRSLLYRWQVAINRGSFEGSLRDGITVTPASTLNDTIVLDPLWMDLEPTIRLCPKTTP